MWQYNTAVTWKSGKTGSLRAEGKPDVAVATPPEFGGPPAVWTPEDLLTGAVASCVMTSFLFFAEKAGVNLVSYESRGTGTMEKTPKGLAVTGVKIEVTLGITEAGQELAVRKAMDRAEQTCPISQSLACPVEVVVSVHVVQGGRDEYLGELS